MTVSPTPRGLCRGGGDLSKPNLINSTRSFHGELRERGGGGVLANVPALVSVKPGKRGEAHPFTSHSIRHDPRLVKNQKPINNRTLVVHRLGGTPPRKDKKISWQTSVLLHCHIANAPAFQGQE